MVLEITVCGKKGQIPPACSWVEVKMVLFYGKLLRLKHDQPRLSYPNRIILSMRSVCLTLNTALADLGFFDVKV